MDRHPLYAAALAADEQYAAAVRFASGGRRDRWTLSSEDAQAQAVRIALTAKISADEAWLLFLRTSREEVRRG